MQLEENLKICLLSIESRFPEHAIDFNEDIIGPQTCAIDGWSAQEAIEQFEQCSPDMLHARARLVVDIQKSEIYLVERSECIPALIVHCRGKIPARRERVPSQQLAQA